MKRKFIILLALFIILRILFALRLPIFNDESIYLLWGKIVGGDPSRWAISLAQDGKQPGTAILMAFTWFITLDPLLTGRAISLICAVTTLIINITIYKKLFQNESENLYILLSAFCPYLILTDSLALQEASLGLALTVCLWATLKIRQKPTIPSGIILGLAFGLGWWIKSTALLALPAIILLILPKYIFIKEKRKGMLISLSSVIVTYLIITAPLLFNPLMRNIPVKESGRIFSISQILTFPIKIWLNHSLTILEFITGYATPIIILLFLIGLIFVKKNKNILLPTIWFLLPTIAAIVAGRGLEARYISPFLPACLMVSASGLINIARGELINFARLHLLFRKYSLNRSTPATEGESKFISEPQPKTERIMIRFFIYNPIIIILFLWSVLFAASPLAFYKAISWSPAAHADFSQYVTTWTSGWGVKDAIEWIIRDAGKRHVTVIMRPDAGNPESAMVAYLNRRPNIDAIFANEFKAYFQTPDSRQSQFFYFVSRGDQLAGMEHYLVPLAKFPKPLDPEYVGIWGFTAQSDGSKPASNP